MSCFFGHKWGKWEQYTQQGTVVPRWGKTAGMKIEVTREGQIRQCERCNKVEDIIK